ncbi:MAG TPA: DUF4089 domain-containing protein [Rubrivivax sp.]|nr:DUF4089 domain-containing protein [Rubrivivax sp.]
MMHSRIIEQQVDATAALISLPIAAEHREGVLRYFGIAAGLATLVMAQPMTIEDEPAAMFVPVEPAERPA